MKILIFLFSVILFTNVYFTSVSCELVDFAVYNANNVTCLLAEFSGKVNHSMANVSEDIAGTVAAGSSCGDTENVLIINGGRYLLRFDFLKANSSIVLTRVVFSSSVTYTLIKDMFTVPEGKSFKCDSGITEYLSSQNGEIVKLELKDMRFNAFREAADGSDYESDSVCDADGGSNKTVPMIIAFVLAGMVVIMLVGYIILRKREDKSTYQTV